MNQNFEKEHKVRIDVMKLLRLLWSDRKKLTVYCGIAGIIGVIYAFSIPRVYTSQVMLAPEEAQGNLNGNISSLASMVGLDMKIGTSDAIYPEIYPDMMHSTTFLVSMFDIPVRSKDGKIKTSLRDYLTHYQKTSWLLWPIKWVGKKIKDIGAKPSPKTNKKANPFWLTKEESDAASAIDGCINCFVDKKTNVITITVKTQDPLIAKTITDSTRVRLQQFITNYRTKKARQDCQYMQKICDEAQAQYVKSRQKYATYSDANLDVLLESVKSVQDELENDMQLKYNIYTQAVQQLQLAQAKVMERTPAFTVIQNSTVPYRHSNMPKIYILAIFLIIGALIRTTILLFKNFKQITTIS